MQRSWVLSYTDRPYSSRKEIDEAVQTLTANRHIGANSIMVRLRQMELHCSREMVRDACRRVDPEGVASRALLRHNIVRRTYRVEHPNALWHVDGNHKLIRWSIVIHGGIDGFSRTVVFLAASDNNKAATVLEQFKVAESHYGLPTRLRIDLGVENVQMAQYMAMKRADVVRPNPVLRGKSCHNQRIERLWVDVWKNVTNMYKDMFLLMEMNGNLNILDARCLWAFTFVFLPRLNASLAAFQQ